MEMVGGYSFWTTENWREGDETETFSPPLVAVGAFLDLYVSYKLADENEITAIVDCRPYMLDEHA